MICKDISDIPHYDVDLHVYLTPPCRLTIWVYFRHWTLDVVSNKATDDEYLGIVRNLGYKQDAFVKYSSQDHQPFTFFKVQEKMSFLQRLNQINYQSFMVEQWGMKMGTRCANLWYEIIVILNFYYKLQSGEIMDLVASVCLSVWLSICLSVCALLACLNRWVFCCKPFILF